MHPLGSRQSKCSLSSTFSTLCPQSHAQHSQAVVPWLPVRVLSAGCWVSESIRPHKVNFSEPHLSVSAAPGDAGAASGIVWSGSNTAGLGSWAGSYTESASERVSQSMPPVSQ